MPHTIKNSFYKHLTFENLLSAHLRAKKQKAKKCEVLRFELNLENNLVNLLKFKMLIKPPFILEKILRWLRRIMMILGRPQPRTF